MIYKVHKEQLRVPAHIDYLADLREFVTQIGKKYKLSEKVVKSFKLAIDEAATNIIRHAYRGYAGQGYITLRAVVRKQSVTFSIIDQGKYFDPNNIKDPDLGRYVQIGKKGGLGIFIMRRLMDHIDYRKTDEGNELRLTKRRPTSVSSRLYNLLPASWRSVPFSLKVRFWFKSSLLLAAAISGVYLYLFVTIPHNILNQRIEIWSTIATQIKHIVERPEVFRDFSGTTSANLNNLLSSYIANRPQELYEIAIVDSAGIIIGHSVYEKTFAHYQPPQTMLVVEEMDNLIEYELFIEDRGERVPIYDYSLSLTLEPEQGPVGRLHLLIYKDYVQKLIASQRWEITRLALLGILVSSAGIFLLIYLVLNPLRKLAEWVRTAGQGEIDDEIDIDPSSEVGEIAKAFSEITTKFRESQKNLAEQERLQKEMQVAQEIQQTLLPHEFPDIEGYEIAGHYEAAQLIGGDYYDFVEVDRDSLGIVVADVSGKGVPGSMVMTMIRQALRTEARGVKDAAEVLARLNELVMGDMKKGMFVTMFYVIIDSKRRRLNYASAGHNPMILYRASSQKTYYLNPRGFPIGIQLGEKDLFRQSIESDTIQLAEDDLLLLYTDGITEAMNSKRHIFGEERLLQVIRQHGHLRAKPFVEALRNEVLSFTEGCPQSDDITFVVIREKTSARKEELRRAREAYRLVMAGTSIRQACEQVGISTYVYYNKYKKEFEEVGVDNFELDESVSVEAKHIAIEDKAKIFDIIKHHPEFGAKRISDELNTEKYGYTRISEKKIYEELVRLRLNTRQLREAFVARGGRRHDRPIKPPGTPMLTLDGRVIIDSSVKTGLPPAPVIEPVSEEAPEKPPASEIQAHETEEPIVAPEPVNGLKPEEPAAPESAPALGEEPDDDLYETTPVEVEDSAEGSDAAAEKTQPLEDVESFAEMMGAESSIVEEDTEERSAEEIPPDPGTAHPFEITTAKIEPDIYAENQVITNEVAADEPQEVEQSGEPISEAAQTTHSALPIADIDELLRQDGMMITTLTGEESQQAGQERDEASHAAPPEQTQGGGESTKELEPHEQMLIQGFRLYKNKQFQEAIEIFQEIVELYPEYKEAYLVLANAYFRKGELDLAADAYEKIKTIDPRDTFPYENMGIVYSKKGQYDKALQEWNRLLEIDPSRKDIREKIKIFERKLNQPTME